MTGPRHSGSSGEFARSAGGATARGLLVVLVAVAVGVFLLARGLDDPLAVAVETGDSGDGTTAATSTTAGDDQSTTTGSGDTTDTTAGGDDTTESTADDGSDGDDTTSTTEEVTAARPPSEVKVQVANGARVSGAAGETTQSLQALGYATGTATNYTGDEILDTSRLHYRLGYLLEAQNLATALNLDPAADIFAIEGDLPIEQPDADPPDIVLLLGLDLAAPSD